MDMLWHPHSAHSPRLDGVLGRIDQYAEDDRQIKVWCRQDGVEWMRASAASGTPGAAGRELVRGFSDVGRLPGGSRKGPRRSPLRRAREIRRFDRRRVNPRRYGGVRVRSAAQHHR